MNIDTFKKTLTENMNSSVELVIPKTLSDERLEDAFKHPECNAEGYAPSLPVVCDSYSYGKTDNGVKILSSKSASVASGLYSRYIDEEALLWDASQQELFIYIPDEELPTVAFKGSSWGCAKKINQCIETLISMNYTMNCK